MKISFYNIGCKVNFSDISRIADDFRRLGHNIVPFEETADVVLINTCTVTNRADADCRKIIRRAERISPNAFIAVLGCYSQINPDEIASIEGVDAVFGTNDKFKIIELIQNFDRQKQAKQFVTNDDNEFYVSSSVDNKAHTRMVLKIQDGCDYFCSYCAVPHARGRSRSMDFNELKAKLTELSETNYYEIILSGINLAEYHAPSGEKFANVIKFIVDSKFKQRFRISSIEPNLLTNDIIDMVLNSDRICNHFHIPLQSGSDDILKLMRRRYNTHFFSKLINNVKNIIPDCCIGIDVITGFPGESDKHFDETYNFINSLPISYLHVFSYSDRDIAQASKFPDKVNPNLKKSRTEKLRLLSEVKRNEFNIRQINNIQTVIPEEYNKKTNILEGWSDNYIRTAFVTNSDDIISPQKVRFIKVENEIMIAEAVDE